MPKSKREVASAVINNMPLEKWQTLHELTRKAKTHKGETLLTIQMAGYLGIAKRLGIIKREVVRYYNRQWKRAFYVSRYKKIRDIKVNFTKLRG